MRPLALHASCRAATVAATLPKKKPEANGDSFGVS